MQSGCLLADAASASAPSWLQQPSPYMSTHMRHRCSTGESLRGYERAAATPRRIASGANEFTTIDAGPSSHNAS